MKRSFLVTLSLAILVTASMAFTGDDQPFKNLKVLPKNIKPEQLDSVMKHFTASLSVKCNFCHMRKDATKEWDYASDENKHKLIARDMMRMTEKINDKYFDVTGGKMDLTSPLMVTCYTCHNGNKQPEVAPPSREKSPGVEDRKN
jgi:hypothetical protein